MDLPRNARVVIVDDKYSEVKGLIQVLAKQGVSTLYYSGVNKQYPDNPLSGVRLLFLDLLLTGISGVQPKDVASKVVNTYRSLIADTNGPLVIVLWTKNVSYCKCVEQYLRKVVRNPYFVICLEKTDCWIKGKKNFYSIVKIRRLLLEKLKSVDIVGINVDFENALFCGANRMIDKFTKLAPIGSGWARMMSYIYAKLCSANNDGLTREGVGRQFAVASRLYSEGLPELVYDILLNNKMNVRKDFCFSEEHVSERRSRKVIGRLNAFLNYSIDIPTKIIPGALYEVESSEQMLGMRSAILNDLYRLTCHATLMKSTRTKLCRLVITPSCDYAHGKELNLARHGQAVRKLDRVIYGLLVPKSIVGRLSKDSFKNCPKAYRQLEDVEFRSERYELIFHLGTVSLELLHARTERTRYLFTLKALPLSDILAHVASQINRIGICTVTARKK